MVKKIIETFFEFDMSSFNNQGRKRSGLPLVPSRTTRTRTLRIMADGKTAALSQQVKSKSEGDELLKRMRSKFPTKRHQMRKTRNGYTVYSYNKKR
jgi:hypothetical protein